MRNASRLKLKDDINQKCKSISLTYSYLEIIFTIDPFSYEICQNYFRMKEDFPNYCEAEILVSFLHQIFSQICFRQEKILWGRFLALQTQISFVPCFRSENISIQKRTVDDCIS